MRLIFSKVRNCMSLARLSVLCGARLFSAAVDVIMLCTHLQSNFRLLGLLKYV